MDPIGPQTKSYPNTKGHQKTKLGEDNSWESNAPKDLGGGFNTKCGTRKSSGGKIEDKWQGTVKGKTKHTYKAE